MRSQNIIQVFLFVVFFGIGAVVLSGSILSDDLLRYYHNRQLLKAKEELSNRLKSLNTDYDALLRQLREDPNLFERIAPAIFGYSPAGLRRASPRRADANTVYPEVTAEQLAAARKALTEEANHKVAVPMLPEWITRCNEPRRRMMLFFAGAFLIVISLICFRPAEKMPQKEG